MRQTSVSWVGFEPAIPANERPKAYALDRAATDIGISAFVGKRNIFPSLLTEFLPDSPNFFQTIY